MKVEAPFFLRNTCSEETLALLQKTTLGTNGAKYQHLNTDEIIAELDNPLFLSLERNQQVLGNVTFCQRQESLYIRYFAFEQIFQSKKSTNNKKKSSLKANLNQFFENNLKEGKNFYAYIDPKNEKSKQMSKTFGFEKIGQVKTYSFSRLKPKSSKFLTEEKASKEVFTEKFLEHNFFTNFQPKRTKIFSLKNEKGEIIASARVQRANWKIERLPGFFGKQFVQIIPYTPILNQFLNPKNYTFLVPDMVYSKDPGALSKLFESILAHENEKLLLWWVDEKEAITNFEKEIKWGIFKLFLGNPPVDIVAKLSENNKISPQKYFFVSGIDLI